MAEEVRFECRMKEWACKRNDRMGKRVDGRRGRTSRNWSKVRREAVPEFRCGDMKRTVGDFLERICKTVEEEYGSQKNG